MGQVHRWQHCKGFGGNLARKPVSLVLFAAFVLVPVVEIALFIQVGGAIGVLWTVLVILLTAAIGATVVRAQGVATLRDLQSRVETGRNPAGPLMHGVLILVAGALLLTPGFFTDTVGFLLLVPPVRAGLVGRFVDQVAARIVTGAASGGAAHGEFADGDVVDGDFERVDPDQPPSDRAPSGWTRPR